MPDSAVTLRRSVKNRTLTLRQVIAALDVRGGMRERRLRCELRCLRHGRDRHGGQTFSRASRVAFRISIVITSSSLGVRFENCPSCEYSDI